MTAFRILNQFPVYLGQTGKPASGGYLLFYDTGTTNPKNVFANKALTINNGNRVDLDASGRTAVDVWGSGDYRVRLYAADNTLIDEADDVEVAGGDAQSIPALVDGFFLTNNGSLMLWAAVRQVPDPTGQNGKVLGTDGSNLLWQTLATVAANCEATITGSGIKLSNGTLAILFQWGSDTVPASGTAVANKAFNFPTAFSALLHVDACINGGPGVANPGGGIPTFGVASRSSTGAVMAIDTNAFGSTINIINPVSFTWFAVGTVAP
jgi:hypothetical protein